MALVSMAKIQKRRKKISPSSFHAELTAFLHRQRHPCNAPPVNHDIRHTCRLDGMTFPYTKHRVDGDRVPLKEGITHTLSLPY